MRSGATAKSVVAADHRAAVLGLLRAVGGEPTLQRRVARRTRAAPARMPVGDARGGSAAALAIGELLRALDAGPRATLYGAGARDEQYFSRQRPARAPRRSANRKRPRRGACRALLRFASRDTPAAWRAAAAAEAVQDGA